jgi:hypothetical protein
VKDVAYVPKTIPDRGQKCHPRCRVLEEILFENLTVDFTDMPQDKGCRYLLVFAPSLDGWKPSLLVEKTQEVARCLIKEITPHFGIPLSIGSDNGLRWYSWWVGA